MGEIRFPPPNAPWSTNQDRNLNPHMRARKIREWKEATIVGVWNTAADEDRTTQQPSIIQVAIPFPDTRKRDPHNYCGTVLKAIIDGLVHAHLWPDDTPEFIAHREPILYKANSQTDQVIVTWEPLNPPPTPTEGTTPT